MVSSFPLGEISPLRWALFIISMTLTLAALYRSFRTYWRKDAKGARRLAIAGAVVVGLIGAALLGAYLKSEADVKREWGAQKARADKEAARIAALTPEQLLAERFEQIRNAISYYKNHHHFEPPMSLWNDLTRTDYIQGPFGLQSSGPFLPGPIENPLTHSSEVVMWGFAKGTEGWEYEMGKGEVRPVRPGVPSPR